MTHTTIGKWHFNFLSYKEDYIYILPLLAVYSEKSHKAIKVGWLRWRGGAIIEKEDE